ncbi:MAG: hypothetical protein D6685_03310 [Bacteroidetes bacterium]|nr:MAG: hypothetical protein D6685_03310 [Bacteroidota bacterium]
MGRLREKGMVVIGLVVLGLGGFGCREAPAPEAEAPPPLTTLYLVRHAEKADDGTDDPPLTEAGQARAERLAAMLQEAGIDAIYATRYRRNQETVAPLAEALGLAVTTHEVQGAALADTLLARHAGGDVVVVGHSNTVPWLLNALVGEARYDQLAEDDYGGLYVVTVAAPGRADVALLRF